MGVKLDDSLGYKVTSLIWMEGDVCVDWQGQQIRLEAMPIMKKCYLL